MFTEQEKQIIQYGIDNGKSKEEVKQALIDFRIFGKSLTKPIIPVVEEKGFLERAGGHIETAGEKIPEILAGEGQYAEETPVRRGFEATAEAFTTIPKIVFEALPKSVREVGGVIGEKIGGAFNWLSEKLGSTKLAQDFVTKHPEAAKTLEEIAGITAAAGEIAGTILVVKAGTKRITKVAETTGKVAQKTISGIETGIGKIKDISQNIKAKAIKLFENPIPEQVKTALGETSGKTFDTYSKLAQDASISYKNKTPLEFAGNRAEEALNTIQKKLKNIGKTKSSILEQANIGNKLVGNIVVKFRQKLNNYLSGKTAVEGDTKLFNDIMNEATKLGSNPSAKAVDKFVDFVQERIYTGKRNLSIPITDEATGALRQMLGELNSNLKTQLPNSYETLNSKYASLVDTRNELNLKLGFEGEKGGALMKRVFSPSDARTKQLFAEVKTITGIDLIDEATIARFVMESIGDARQASLLQQLQLPNLSKRGMLQLAKEILDKKLNTPEQILNRARELTTETQLREAIINKTP